jgi:hypothetical protein
LRTKDAILRLINAKREDLMQLLIGILIIVGLIAIIFFLAHLQEITDYFVEKFNTPYTENMTNCAGVDCSECNELRCDTETYSDELNLDTIETYYEADEEEEYWGEEGFKTYIDVLEFERIIEGDIRVGDCFIEIKGEFAGAIRIVTKLYDDGDIAYEFCGDSNVESHLINTENKGLSKKEIIEDVELGVTVYAGTFDLGEDNE